MKHPTGQYDPHEVRPAAMTWSVRRWVPGVDLLRGAAALAVVLDHSAQQTFPGEPTHAPGRLVWWLGSWGITLFFVISGFCIHLPYARRAAKDENDSVDWGRFFRRRARRLLPAHYCALAVAAVVGQLVTTNLVGPASARTLLAHVVMIHPWVNEKYFYSINGVFWSIAVEVHFYLAYPLFLRLRAKLRAALPLVLFFVGLTAYGLASRLHDPDVRFVGQHLFIVSWWQWALGALLADVYVARQAGVWARWISRKTTGIIVLAASISMGAIDPVVLRLHVRYWILPVLCSLIVANRILAESELPWTRWLSGLGHASYSLYLIHPVAIAIAWLLVTRRSAALEHSLGSFAIYVGASVLACGVFFWLVERHFVSPRPLEAGVAEIGTTAAMSRAS